MGVAVKNVAEHSDPPVYIQGLLENKGIAGLFENSERMQDKKAQEAFWIPRLLKTAFAAVCRKRRLFRFFKQPGSMGRLMPHPTGNLRFIFIV
ncbi:hypothetical protein [Anaerotruncus colihominis]|uniref:hypothetical protein n=1 Tax=Anaerotruncus colihominis TaxID=169435 RepID=UPI00189BA120|nr:hypothetical protein [Anaerotruncus colihominis]